MLRLVPVPAFDDNYLWLAHDGSRAVVVDPGDAAPVAAALQRLKLQLSAILLTHHHADHIGGVAALLERFAGVDVYAPDDERIEPATRRVGDGDTVDIEAPGLRLRVLALPGHTRSHIGYYGAGLLFCGDTLFSAGCGRLFEGTPAQMHASLSRLSALPPPTAVYCAHEYTLSNLRFACAVEPENPEVLARFDSVSRWREQGRISLPSSIALERATNPFLRVSETSVKKMADERSGQQIRTPEEVFATIRRWKDQF